MFYANFQGKDPNEENVEITVRENCFYPQKEGVGFITLSGFTVNKAATQWAPPTAYQEGMIGPHWSKGWIIEDCDISESKCSGISVGKYLQPGDDNKWLQQKYKDGTQTERDCICRAQREGWTKEKIGSHIIRRCNIHDCGQTGIVGHLGGVFSVIEDNHIHHINNKQNLAGAEIGGIKMHAGDQAGKKRTDETAEEAVERSRDQAAEQHRDMHGTENAAAVRDDVKGEGQHHTQGNAGCGEDNGSGFLICVFHKNSFLCCHSKK